MKTKAKKNGAAARPAKMQRNVTPPAAPATDATQPAPATSPAAATAAPRGPGNGKAVFSIRLTPALLDKARNACFFTPGLTLAALTEAALTRELARMEAERGGPFENRTADIPRGRRIV
jgi:uncharacterized protein (DUF4415 family)